MPWDAIIESDDPRWDESLQTIGRHDFHHLRAYGALEAERQGGQARAFVYTDGGARVLVPFIESPVPLMVCPEKPCPLDAGGPYGYAGPILGGEEDEIRRGRLLAAALTRLVERFRERGICAFMLRFHPLLPPPLEPFRKHGTLVQHGETVWTDLSQTLEQMWADTGRSFRKPINRLRNRGFQFELDLACAQLPQTVGLYHDTMRRVGANPQYYFSGEYFQGLQRALGPRLLLAHVRNPDGLLVASGMFTICSGMVQSHLAGSNLDEDGADASKLLLHQMRGWAKEQGWAQFHLGGGVGGRNGSLFWFKSNFSSSRAPFHTWRLIVDEPAYAKLCRQWEKIHGTRPDAADGYFPAYRKITRPAAVSFSGGGGGQTSLRR